MLRSYGNPDSKKLTVRTGKRTGSDTPTIQSAKEECDINTIVRRFGVTGQIPVSAKIPHYGDYEDIFDFQSAQNALIEARDSFLELPAAIRRRFSNSPQEFLQFCSDKDNLPELRRMGLAKALPPENNDVGSNSNSGKGAGKSKESGSESNQASGS